MFLVCDIINILLTELSRSVWESLHLSHDIQTDLTGFHLHSPLGQDSHVHTSSVNTCKSYCNYNLEFWCTFTKHWVLNSFAERSFPGCTVHVDSTDVKRISFILGVKGTQVEEIYDLSKSFKGCVQYGSTEIQNIRIAHINSFYMYAQHTG